MGFALKFREQLTGAIRDEFENLVSSITGWSRLEHNTDGTHGDVTATSLSLQGAGVGELVDLPYDAARFYTGGSGVWTVAEADLQYLKATRIGQIVIVWFGIDDSALTVDVAEQLYIRIPEFHAFPSSRTGNPYQMWEGGSASYVDAAGDGIASTFALAQPQSNIPYTVVEVDKISPTNATYDDWAVGAISVWGMSVFPCVPNNIPTPFAFGA